MTDSLPLLLAAAFLLLGFVAMGGLILLVLIRTVRRVGRHGSVAGALYDGRVAHTYGTLDAASRGIAKVRLKVVGVEREAPAVGLEIHVNARLGYNMRAVRLTPDEALRVAEALEAVARR